MRRFLSHYLPVLIGVGLLLSGCAPRAYNEALQTARSLEGRQDYEQAYQYYERALAADPDDAQAKSNLNRLASTISDLATKKGMEAYSAKKHKAALPFFNKALRYRPDNDKARDYLSKSTSTIEMIRQKYSEAESMMTQNKWVTSVQLLEQISEISNDDPEILSKIESRRTQGYNYFIKEGLAAREAGNYNISLDFLRSAGALKETSQVQKELEAANKYMKAESGYLQARKMVEQSNIQKAMDVLIEAKGIVKDHSGINKLILEIMPVWSPEMLSAGQQYIDSSQFDMALETLTRLYKTNPDYPEAEYHYKLAKILYLKKYYRDLVSAQHTGSFSSIFSNSAKITEVDTAFLDTTDIMTRASLRAFNLFYQQGVDYLEKRNYGKAILCFRSAEEQLASTKLTRDLISEAMEQIKEDGALKIAFWEFFQSVGDPGISQYATNRLKELFRSRIEKKKFKNISLYFDEVKDNGILARSVSQDVDWSAIQSHGCNTLIVGKIKLLNLDKSLTSEWKTKTRTIKKFVDNEEYNRLDIQRAELNRRLNGYGGRQQDLLDQIAKIKERLDGIPKKIEKEFTEETPYEITTHKLIAYLQIDVQILAPDGSLVWPPLEYNETYSISDNVIPPILTSEDPQERQGDPLRLPTESTFKEQAVNHVLENKIFPEIVANLEDYGMRFYNQATTLHKAGEEIDPESFSFKRSIEEYFKFLASYEDKGEEDTLSESILEYLDAFACAKWLIRQKK